MIQWLGENGLALVDVVIIDLVLAGDNAVIVGLAASRVAPELRAKVIGAGVAGAVLLRVAFAAVTTQLLQITGLTLAGGLLLLFVCWKMYRQVAGGGGHGDAAAAAESGRGAMGFWPAVAQVVLADVTMSLDNVLAVAGAAKGSALVLTLGLGVAIVLMAVASHYVAKLLVSYPWITWIGLAIIVWVALDMIWDGSHEVACKAASSFWCEHDLSTVVRRGLSGG